MENVDRWLKSLRLHKYNYLFRRLTYDEMLNIREKFLIDLDITKGARNKILVSIKKLNLRHDRLVNMEDDLNQDNITLKEALTVMKEMLITPIPKTYDESSPSPSISLPDSPSPSTSGSSGYDCTDYSPGYPCELTQLFVETFEKLALRLFDMGRYGDKACHAIMAAIMDDCLRHDSFTREQKARIARLRYNSTRRLIHKPAPPPREYTLLGPGPTFELPCLRAAAAIARTY